LPCLIDVAAGFTLPSAQQARGYKTQEFQMQKIWIALVLIFLCGAAIVAYVWFAGADKRAVGQTLENARIGVKNSDPDLLLAQVSKDYNYDGHSYEILKVLIPTMLKTMNVDEITFTNITIVVEGKKAHATFHFTITHSLKEVLGVTVAAEIVTAGNAEVNFAKEADGWKIIEAGASDNAGEKMKLR
jgi:hypothetical protein